MRNRSAYGSAAHVSLIRIFDSWRIAKAYVGVGGAGCARSTNSMPERTKECLRNCNVMWLALDRILEMWRNKRCVTRGQAWVILHVWEFELKWRPVGCKPKLFAGMIRIRESMYCFRPHTTAAVPSTRNSGSWGVKEHVTLYALRYLCLKSKFNEFDSRIPMNRRKRQGRIRILERGSIRLQRTTRLQRWFELQKVHLAGKHDK